MYDGDELTARDKRHATDWEGAQLGRGGGQAAQSHSPGRVGTDLLELLSLATDLFWIGLRGVLRARVKRAILRLVVVPKER